MEGISKYLRLRTATKIAAALLVVGAVTIGAAVSGSSSGSTQSSWSVQRLAFGKVLGMHLEVVNKNYPSPFKVSICGRKRSGITCYGTPVGLGIGESIANSGDEPDTVYGTIRYPDGFTVDFEAHNPTVGEPWVKVTAPNSTSIHKSYTFHLSEGEKAPHSTQGYDAGTFTEHPFTASRAADTFEFKNLILYACGFPRKCEP